MVNRTAQTIGRMTDDGEKVWIIATPHFLEDWELERYGKSKARSLDIILGSWNNNKTFYEQLLDAPLGETYYAVLRKRHGLKPVAFIYFRNIENEVRGSRRELELISVTPPIRGKTQGINLITFHDHQETEKWIDLNYR